MPSPPSNLSVTQLSLTSVEVSWSPAPQDGVAVSKYFIFYQLVTGGSEMTLHTSYYSTNKIIHDLVEGGVYSFSMASTSYILTNSTKTAPFNTSLGMIIITTQLMLLSIMDSYN